MRSVWATRQCPDRSCLVGIEISTEISFCPTTTSLPSNSSMVCQSTLRSVCLSVKKDNNYTEFCRPISAADVASVRHVRSVCRNELMVPRHKLSSAHAPVCFRVAVLSVGLNLADYSGSGRPGQGGGSADPLKFGAEVRNMAHMSDRCCQSNSNDHLSKSQRIMLRDKT